MSNFMNDSLLNDIFTDSADFLLVEQVTAINAGLLEAEQKSNCKKVALSGKNSHTVSDFMQEFYDVLNFPAYFGRNWSAFSDSFQERLGEDEDNYKRYLLVFTDADELLSEAAKDDISALLETLQDSIEALANPESIMAVKIVFCVKDVGNSRIRLAIINGNHKCTTNIKRNKATWSWPFPKVIGHRGGGILAPENTLMAIKLGAIDYQLKAVEFDVMLSRDKVPFLMHDDVLERTVRSTISLGKSFGDVPASEIREMDAGSWFEPSMTSVRIPLFEDVLKFCTENAVWMNIEIKPVPGQEQDTGRIVATMTSTYFPNTEAKNMPLFSSFSYEALLAAAQAAPHIPRGYLLDSIDDVPDWQQRMQTLGAIAVHVDHKFLSPAHVAAIKERGYGLFCYTVNEVERGRELFEMGADAFCTDRIDLFGTPTPAP